MIGRIVFVFGIALSVSAIPISAAQASWGCGATDGVSTGRSWGFQSQTAASYRALAECAQRSKRGHCRVAGCSPSVNTYSDAHVTWFSGTPTPPLVEREAAKVAQTSVRVSTVTATTGKCASVQARCAIEVGATCDPKTGYWCVGGQRSNRYCGGNHAAWLACLDRVRATRR
jgi:hypothetical protein